jgi:hypothetical protein
MTITPTPRPFVLSLLLLLLSGWFNCSFAAQTVKLAWDASPDPDIVGYTLYYGPVGGPTLSRLPVGRATTAHISYLTAGTTYFIYVTASNSSGVESEASNALTYTPTGQTQLLANGNFASGYTGWTETGNQKIAVLNGTNAVYFNFGEMPADGVLSQQYMTTLGQQYLLSFDLAAFSLVNQDEQEMQVTVQGTNTLLSQTASVFAPGNGFRWVTHNMAFVADSSVTMLTFTDVSPTTKDVDLYLDNVRVAEGN